MTDWDEAEWKEEASEFPDWRDADLSEFPERILESSTPLHRIHRASRRACFFGGSGDHRFDPLPGHSGTFGVCYFGLEPLAAYVEVFGRVRAVQRSDIDARRLSTARVTRPLRVADLTQREVLGRFGVTAAHSTGADYRPAQMLSARLNAAGFDGILYRIRHDPQMELEALALYGELGATAHTSIRLERPSPIPGSLINAGRQFGFQALPQWTGG